MSKTRVIPELGNNPFVTRINGGKEYSYPAGTTQTVPDEVADLIDNIYANIPTPAPEPGKPGQVWTRQTKGGAWDNFPIELPSTGTAGQFLKKTASGCEWGTPESYTLPAATESALGGVKQAAALEDISLEDATAASVGAKVNALLSALRAAGIMVYEAP